MTDSRSGFPPLTKKVITSSCLSACVCSASKLSACMLPLHLDVLGLHSCHLMLWLNKWLCRGISSSGLANGNCLSGNPLATQPRRRRETRWAWRRSVILVMKQRTHFVERHSNVLRHQYWTGNNSCRGDGHEAVVGPVLLHPKFWIFQVL